MPKDSDAFPLVLRLDDWNHLLDVRAVFYLRWQEFKCSEALDLLDGEFVSVEALSGFTLKVFDIGKDAESPEQQRLSPSLVPKVC